MLSLRSELNHKIESKVNLQIIMVLKYIEVLF
jgi:hypothetical protein